MGGFLLFKRGCLIEAYKARTNRNWPPRISDLTCPPGQPDQLGISGEADFLHLFSSRRESPPSVGSVLGFGFGWGARIDFLVMVGFIIVVPRPETDSPRKPKTMHVWQKHVKRERTKNWWPQSFDLKGPLGQRDLGLDSNAVIPYTCMDSCTHMSIVDTSKYEQPVKRVNL